MTTGQAQWVVADHDMAYIGDHVILLRPPDTAGVIVGVDGFTGVPIVEITTGPRTGEKVSVWPSLMTTITKRAKRG